MHLSKVRGFTLAACLLVLAGCAAKPAPQSSYGVNGTQYHTADEALGAARAFGAEQIAAIGQVQDRIGGRALIVLPDDDRLRPVEAAKFKTPLPPVSMDFFMRSERQSLDNAAGALSQTNLFDHADIVLRNDTEDPPMDGYDWLVWYKVGTTGPNHTGQWYAKWQIRSASNPVAETINFDIGVAPKERMVSFVKSAKLGATQLASGSVTAPSLSPSQLASASAKGSLSGFIVGPHGDIVTNEHGFNGCNGVRVRSGAETLAGSIVARDHQNDLVLLHVDRNFSSVASFRDGGSVRQGDSIVVVGYPLGKAMSSNATVTTGTISGLSGVHDDTRFLQISAPVQQGNSGGPLVDSSGHVVGLVTAKLSALLVAAATGDIPQNVNFALKSSVVRDFLETNGVKYRTAANTTEQHTADTADQAKAFTVFIECLK
ncbi:MAG TPA: serine protease [Aliidongia sp.]|nr:serine protease [Aliidongia sp.]